MAGKVEIPVLLVAIGAKVQASIPLRLDRDPNSPLMHYNAKRRPTSNFASVSESLVHIPTHVKEQVEVTDFHHFLGTLPGFNPRYNLTTPTVLLERWSNTSHTFLLPFRKITDIPLDFVALMGIQFGGVSLLGSSPFIKDEKKLRYGDLKTYWQPQRKTVMMLFTNKEVDHSMLALQLHGSRFPRQFEVRVDPRREVASWSPPMIEATMIRDWTTSPVGCPISTPLPRGVMGLGKPTREELEEAWVYRSRMRGVRPRQSHMQSI
ncbi:conserved hypothetical protein [Ricinus communis]|uniref:Uncharacterized protein n=1 Tax=Ricinus communis TaxID=3988 RepID=B9S3R7_RICCO|nr:conserved hypothetical protein [Ricinus communis]